VNKKRHTSLGEALDKKTPNVKLVDFSWIAISLFLGRIVIFCKDFLKRC
jgi:hypothetical protein